MKPANISKIFHKCLEIQYYTQIFKRDGSAKFLKINLKTSHLSSDIVTTSTTIYQQPQPLLAGTRNAFKTFK